MRMGRKLCPVCTHYTDQADVVCPHCGYNFATGERAPEPVPVPHEPLEDDAAAPVEGLPPPDRTHAGLRTIVAVLVILGIAAPLLLALPLGDAVDRAGEPRPVAPAGRGGSRACTRLVRAHVEELVHSTPDEAQAAILETADELGAGSFEYEVVIRVYGDEKVLGRAARGRTGGALRRARRLIKNECRKGHR